MRSLMSVGFFKGIHSQRLQGATSHRGDCPVDNVCQRASSLVKGIENFEIAEGEPVEQHAGGFVDAGNRGDVPDKLVLGGVEVIEYCPGGGYATIHFVNPEPFQCGDFEMFFQSVGRGFCFKEPFFYGIGVVF